jgi:hypothetical protein
MKCSICRDMLTGKEYGHNAYPINDGRCCDRCNSTYVIPSRISNIARERPNYQLTTLDALELACDASIQDHIDELYDQGIERKEVIAIMLINMRSLVENPDPEILEYLETLLP